MRLIAAVMFLWITGVVCFPRMAQAKELAVFAGVADLGKKTAVIDMDFTDGGKANINVKLARGNIVRFTAKFEHVKTPWFDISTDLYGGWKIIPGLSGEEELIQGQIGSRYTLVDYKPFRDPEIIFQVGHGQLILQKLSFGPLSVGASVTLAAPHTLDGKLVLTDYSLADFLSFWLPERKNDSGGSLDASIRFQGAPDKLYVRVKAESRDGYIEHFNFTKMVLNFDGVYPRLYIGDANIIDHRGMSFSIMGPLDLSEMKNIKQQIEALTISPLVVDTDRKSEWTIRRFDKEGETVVTSFKAFLNKSDLGMDSSGMIGVERKIEF